MRSTECPSSSSYFRDTDPVNVCSACHSTVTQGRRQCHYLGPFIATQLKSTRRRVELCRYKRALR